MQAYRRRVVDCWLLIASLYACMHVWGQEDLSKGSLQRALPSDTASSTMLYWRSKRCCPMVRCWCAAGLPIRNCSTRYQVMIWLWWYDDMMSWWWWCHADMISWWWCDDIMIWWYGDMMIWLLWHDVMMMMWWYDDDMMSWCYNSIVIWYDLIATHPW